MSRRKTLSRIALLVAFSCFLAGCEDDPRGIVQASREMIQMDRAEKPTIRLDAPDPDFKLTSEERANIRRGFDADALERLLAAVEPEARPILLRSFRQPRPGESPGEWTTPAIQMGDRALQPLLEEVWATAWEQYPELLDNEHFIYPGKEIAKERRRLRQQK